MSDKPPANDELGQRRTVLAARARLRDALEYVAIELEIPSSEVNDIEEMVKARMRGIVSEKAGSASPNAPAAPPTTAGAPPKGEL